MYVENNGPEAEPGIHNESAVETAVQLWSSMTSCGDDASVPQPMEFTVEMMNITPFGQLNNW